MSVYVEIRIRSSLDSLWTHTQLPDRHQQWDLRFSEIEYLERASPGDVQRFRYTTRLGFGIAVSGEGETVGQRDLPDGSRSSALRFGSESPISLIREGSGYWKYVPTADGVRFLTSYDYRTRFGRVGAVVDRLVFRPLIGWATAWSFDRLRLWLEDGVPPAISARSALLHGIARVGLAVTFAYHGLLPKLLGPNADELTMFRASGIPASGVGAAVVAVGIAEIVFAICLLGSWHRRWPAVACLAFAVLTTVGAILASPSYLGAAFNPVTLNLGVACLAAIDLLTLHGSPSAGRCRRSPSEASA